MIAAQAFPKSKKKKFPAIFIIGLVILIKNSTNLKYEKTISTQILIKMVSAKNPKQNYPQKNI